MIDKVKEEIEIIIGKKLTQLMPDRFNMPRSLNGEQLTKQVLEIPYIAKALEIYQKYLDGKLVELDEDQRLPQIPQRILLSEKEKIACALQDMLNDNWKRVKKND